MKPPIIQPDHSRDRDPLAMVHRELRHMTTNALHLRASIATNWMANEVRNYVSTLERDMDYKVSNQPLSKGSHTRLPVGVYNATIQ